MNEFNNQTGPVNDVEFHPHEFLLAGANQDRTVSFWDLEKFALIGSTERDTGPVRCIYFHPEGECLFSGTQDNLRVHGWEPSRSFDSLPVSWSKISDIATASQQLIGASFQQTHVSLYVVDLKRVQPFCGVNIPEKEPKPAENVNVTFRPGQTVRRSFVKESTDAGKRPPTQVKISEETSDKSGTEGEDSDAVSHADIPDIGNYQNVFRPRNRELNRTPPPPDEPFEEPPGSDLEMPMPVRAVDPMNFHASKLNKKVSPSPTRRASQPAMPSGYHSGVLGGRRGSVSSNSDVMKPQDFHMRHNPHSGQRPVSVYDPSELRGGRSSSQSVPRELPSSPVRANFRTAVNLNTCKDSPDQEYLPGVPQHLSLLPSVPYGATSPVKLSSPIKSHPASSLPYSSPSYHPLVTPLDRPTAVRPQRTSEAGFPVYESGTVAESHEKMEMVPSMSDKPTGLNASDFLPQKFGGLKIGLQTPNDKFGYEWPQNHLSESEVTSSILKDHPSIMSVIMQRSRNIAIIRQLWHSKDAKTAVEQAVEFNDPAIIVDLLSVIILRPSIWNLDLCLNLLPPIGNLLLSKYENYVTGASSALKLVLKTFGTVIKSNIDTPSTSVGVDISKEERLNKCLDCYRELVKIRSTILKRQTLQGKCGHAFRELAILMQ